MGTYIDVLFVLMQFTIYLQKDHQGAIIQTEAIKPEMGSLQFACDLEHQSHYN